MINTTLCYLEQDGKYLMLHRVKKENDINKDKWIGIGGKFEEGESPEECLLREVKEETGLTLTDWRCCGIITFLADQHPAEYMHLFWSDAFEGSVSDCDEGVLEWIAKEELFQLPLWEGDKIFLKMMQEHHPFFLLKLEYQTGHLRRAVLNGKEI